MGPRTFFPQRGSARSGCPVSGWSTTTKKVDSALTALNGDGEVDTVIDDAALNIQWGNNGFGIFAALASEVR
jgi:hypothetical protein